MATGDGCLICGNKIDKRAKQKTGLCRECFIKSVNVNGEAKCKTCSGPTNEPRAEYCKKCWLSRPVEGRKTSYRKYQMKRKYKLSLEQYDEILQTQGGKCAICLIEQSELAHSLFVDHDRSCCPGSESCGNCVRGLLCSNCNFGIGQFKDNETTMKSAIKYIRKYKKEVI